MARTRTYLTYKEQIESGELSVQINLRLPLRTRVRLIDKAKEEKTSVSQLIREGIDLRVPPPDEL